MATRKSKKQFEQDVKEMTGMMAIEDLLEQAKAILHQETASRAFAQPVEKKLDRIFELQGTENEVAREIDQMLDKLNAQRGELTKPIVEERKKIEQEVKAECLERQETIAGTYLQVVWSAGTRSANLDGIEDYGKLHPDVLSFIKQSAPVAKIVTVKKGKK